MTEGYVDHTIETLQLGDSETGTGRPTKRFSGKAVMRLNSAMERTNWTRLAYPSASAVRGHA